MNIVNAIRPMPTGVNLTAGAASTSAAIPDGSSGRPARYVRVTPVAACSCHVRIGVGTQTAVATDMLLVGATGSVVLDTSGCDTIAVIQEGTGGMVNVAPVGWA